MGCSSLISIDFAGTQEQWNKIEKHESWLNDSNIQFIRCIDGEITLKRELTESVAKKTKNTKRKTILDKLFKIGDLYFTPSKDRLSVEVTRNEDDKYIFENVIIPEYVDYMGAKYPVTSIGGDAFCDCFSLTSISIPDSVKDIGYGAFWGCRSLTSITLPDHVRMIGCVFLGCISLTSIIIPNGVTNIGKRAFFRCSSLSSVTLPNSVTSIGKRAFYGCSSLTSITIPSSVKSIGKRAFKDCLLLNSINYAGTQEQWMKIEKDDNWMSGSEIKVIHCEDGEIVES
jgi:hypothetical protein